MDASGDNNNSLESETLEIPVEEIREMQLKFEERGRVMEEYIKIIDLVRGECQTYHTKYEQLQAINLQQQNQIGDLGRQLFELNELKATEDRVFEEKARLWTQKYEAKCRELEQLQAQLVPSRELEVVRRQVLDDMEKPFREKLTHCEQETEKYREQFFSLRREHETLRQTLVQSKLEHANALDDFKAKADRDTTILNERMRVLQTIIDEGLDAERVRVLEREKSELEVRFKQLEEETVQLRIDNEKLKLHRNKSEVSHQVEVGDEMTRGKSLQAENEALARRVRHLEKELDTAVKAHERLHDRILILERENSNVRNQLEEAVHTLTTERTASNRRLLDIEREWNAERGDHTRDTENLHSRIEELQNHYNEALTKVATQEKDTALRVKKAKEEEHEKISRLEVNVVALEKELEGCRRVEDEKNVARIQEATNLQKELQALKNEKRGVCLELKAAQDRAERFLIDLQQAQGETVAIRSQFSDLQSELRRLNDKLSRAADKEAGLRADKQAVELQLDLVSRDCRSFQDELAAERESHSHALEQVKKKVSKDRSVANLMSQQLRVDLDNAVKDKLAISVACEKQTAALKERLRKYRSKLQVVLHRLARSEFEHGLTHEQNKENMNTLAANLEIQKLTSAHHLHSYGPLPPHPI
eukprot:gnl/Hemi2/6804_TR2316_c0_g1_i1.p1 gnl/Hemi2/6804_TR2316_c0_g1~~gnl/Hemi2/6804_TR2316_c0_g1_i1.p1  ORF type:complete len:650 (+),score=313.46 gnl/Hemi2/6804_TR2316_c0_g1_i1:127-2076(+)